MGPGPRPQDRGIIPARAGFTCALVCGRPVLGDHPRSRGVYSFARSLESRSSGSSPLARGLQTYDALKWIVQRIIPARAGFTWICRTGTVCCRGSSPLARGLRDAEGRPQLRDRIIPARAGFTELCLRNQARRGDHPRSRGVYRASRSSTVAKVGSSPLARGLLARATITVFVDGIIPARAGFTSPRRIPRRYGRDHPRSRGVYPVVIQARDAKWGSSPLARGLHRIRSFVQEHGGIIPARAGFTHEHHRRPRAHGDHPRSRGVYSGHRGRTSRTRGSSPLARGLRQIGERAWDSHRIIPARAGFTAPAPGSRDCRRIIPARAGFTQEHSECSRM